MHLITSVYGTPERERERERERFSYSGVVHEGIEVFDSDLFQ